MADVIAELKDLRLHGMAATWAELGEQRNAEVERSRWLLEHMLQAEASDRATRSVQQRSWLGRDATSRSRPWTASWSRSWKPARSEGNRLELKRADSELD